MLSRRERELAPTAALNEGLPCLDWYLMPESFSAPLIESAISEYKLIPGQTVLDPFSGSGITALTAKLYGLNGVGIEVNPFLCFAARVKTHFEYDLSALAQDLEMLLSCTAPRLAELSLNPPLFPPDIAIKETPAVYQVESPPDMPRLYHWMSPRVVDKVMILKSFIQTIENRRHYEFARLALAAILRPVSNMKLTPHAFGSRVKKEDAHVYDAFNAKIRKMYADLKILAGWEGPFGETAVIEQDVRTVAAMEHPLLPADLAITSPPYLNNLDYTMQTRMELFFLDFVQDMAGLRELRKRMMVSDAKAMYKDVKDHELIRSFPSIQTITSQLEEKHKDKNWGWNYAFMTAQYFGGMLRMLQSVRPLLKPGANFWLVLGESSHSGVVVPVPKIVGELAEAVGYKLEEIRVLRKRRSSSHNFELCESTVVLRNLAG